jgi:hypothetical protein
MSAPRHIVEYMSELMVPVSPSIDRAPEAVAAEASVPDDSPEPLERLEARLCELAGHLTAATCQFLLLVADFDRREGWGDWEMPSCAAWLSWKCQIAPGTAREQVRVARSVAEYPLIRREFAAGRLSYAKVRALTRIATPETETDLVEMATPMTAGQLERFAQAHRRVSEADHERPRPARKLTWSPAGDLDYKLGAVLPAEAAAVVFQALRAARHDLEHPHDDHDHSDDHDNADDRSATSFTAAEPPPAEMESTEHLADALVQICADYLSARASSAENPDTYQVIIHAGVRAVTGPEPGALSAAALEPGAWPAALPKQASVPEPAGVSAETLPFWHPAHPDRCHLDDGPAISSATLALIGCNATISTMIHDLSGAVIDVGRRTRKIPPALRRALRERDRGRCQYPGCDSRRTDAHHIRHWANGGHTNLANLISICGRHHRLVHDKNHIITAAGTGFVFYTREGTPIPSCPQLPHGPGDLTTAHHARITATTINPPNSGEHLNLSLAIWIAFANARTQAARREAAETGVG